MLTFHFNINPMCILLSSFCSILINFRTKLLKNFLYFIIVRLCTCKQMYIIFNVKYVVLYPLIIKPHLSSHVCFCLSLPFEGLFMLCSPLTLIIYILNYLVLSTLDKFEYIFLSVGVTCVF